ncbi:MAG: VTT domain-containing protein [Planctomycetes bacterium]|nr:VTT domain-containing protein [Planctomycetota bacterium]
MEEWVESLLKAAGDQPGLVEFLILGAAAMLEYVVPPVPGDVIVLLGALLVGANGWSLPAVVAAVSGGSLAGLTIDYAFGRWVGRRDPAWREKYPRWRRTGAAIDRIKASFERWGAVYIACNRFLPAIRAAFFVAAGVARIPYWKVALWGLVSSLLWNCLIFAVGMSVGYHREKLFEFFRGYSAVAWIAVGAIAAVIIFRWRRGIRRSRSGG